MPLLFVNDLDARYTIQS